MVFGQVIVEKKLMDDFGPYHAAKGTIIAALISHFLRACGELEKVIVDGHLLEDTSGEILSQIRGGRVKNLYGIKSADTSYPLVNAADAMAFALYQRSFGDGSPIMREDIDRYSKQHEATIVPFELKEA
jgi:hypothetical protein